VNLERNKRNAFAFHDAMFNHDPPLEAVNAGATYTHHNPCATAAEAAATLGSVCSCGDGFMKNRKRCPKCPSDDIIPIPGKREADGAGTSLA